MKDEYKVGFAILGVFMPNEFNSQMKICAHMAIEKYKATRAEVKAQTALNKAKILADMERNPK